MDEIKVTLQNEAHEMIVMDTSSSMRWTDGFLWLFGETRMEKGINFVELLASSKLDRKQTLPRYMSLIKFDSQITVLIDRELPKQFRKTFRSIRNQQLQPVGTETRILDALAEAFNLLSHDPAKVRRILFITDGGDTGSSAENTDRFGDEGRGLIRFWKKLGIETFYVDVSGNLNRGLTEGLGFHYVGLNSEEDIKTQVNSYMIRAKTGLLPAVDRTGAVVTPEDQPGAAIDMPTAPTRPISGKLSKPSRSKGVNRTQTGVELLCT